MVRSAGVRTTPPKNQEALNHQGLRFLLLKLTGTWYSWRFIESHQREMTRYEPLKPGPLHEVKIGTGTTTDTFRSSSYFETVLDEPLKVYRVYGGESGELGRY